MPKIKLPRGPAPALPFAPATYSPRYHEQLNNILRLYFAQQDNFAVNTVGALNSTGPYITMPYGMFMSDASQMSAGVTAANLVKFDKPIFSDGITVVNDTKLKFDHPGQYLITFSLMVTNRDNAEHEFEVWARRNGSNYPLSNTRFDLPPRKSASIWSHTVAAVSGIFTVEDPPVDELSIAWWSDGPTVFLEYYPARTNPDRPEIPPVILTANFISALP